MAEPLFAEVHGCNFSSTTMTTDATISAETPSDGQRLQRLLDASYPCIAISTYEEDYAQATIAACAIEKGVELYAWSVTRGVYDGLVAGGSPMPNTDNPAAALYHFTHNRTTARRAIFIMFDALTYLKDDRTLRALREAVRKVGEMRSTLILVDHQSALPQCISAVAARFEISFPGTEEIEQLIKATLRRCHDERRISVDLSRRSLSTVVGHLRGLTRRQVKQIVNDAISDDQRFDENDLANILAGKRRALGGDTLLEYVEAPTDMKSIGGLVRLKRWLDTRKNCLSEEARAFGLPAPRGVLLLGVQGAGKSLAAKAVATAWQRPLLRMDVGMLYDRYIGESERRLRDTLRQAEQMAPVVLWIDEIEKGFASAASQSTDGGLSKRMFGSLLTWMQEHAAPVFVVATANDIEAMPPELLRKGRFDEIFFVDLPVLEARVEIFTVHLAKRGRVPRAFDLAALAAQSEGFSGAEIEQAVIAGLHTAFAEQVDLASEHLIHALRSSPPLSITMRERIDSLRAWSHGRCVAAD